MESDKEKEGVNHQSLSPSNGVIDEASNGGKDEVGDDPGTRHPTPFLNADREVEAEVEGRNRRAVSQVENFRLLPKETVQKA